MEKLDENQFFHPSPGLLKKIGRIRKWSDVPLSIAHCQQAVAIILDRAIHEGREPPDIEFEAVDESVRRITEDLKKRT